MNFDHTKFKIRPFQKKVEKPWGYEIIYSPEKAPAVGKLLHINSKKRLSLQYHDSKTETLCLIRGQAIITLSNKKNKMVEIPMELFKGYYVIPGQIHRIQAVTDCDVIESSEPEKGNTYRIEDDAGRPTETEEMRKLDNRGWIKNF